MNYDLIVVGNGQAAQTFLFEFFKKLDVKKRQNFSVAQVYSEDIAASCSLRSTATVSLNGVEEGVSALGDELRSSFFLFEEFYNTFIPLGVEKISQIATYSSPKEKAKMIRRYKSLKEINHPILKQKIEGIEQTSYLINPKIYSQWFTDQLIPYEIKQKKDFLKNIKKNDADNNLVDCELLSGEVLITKKLVLCTGAYAKLFAAFYTNTSGITKEIEKTEMIAGSYLEQIVNLERPSFYFTIDETNLIYKSMDHQLIIGSASKNGSIIMANHEELKKILARFNKQCNFPIGELKDFKIVTGLRHKASKRRPFAQSIDVDKKIYLISGFYKNGYTFSHLCAKSIVNEVIL